MLPLGAASANVIFYLWTMEGPTVLQNFVANISYQWQWQCLLVLVSNCLFISFQFSTNCILNFKLEMPKGPLNVTRYGPANPYGTAKVGVLVLYNSCKLQPMKVSFNCCFSIGQIFPKKIRWSYPMFISKSLKLFFIAYYNPMVKWSSAVWSLITVQNIVSWICKRQIIAQWPPTDQSRCYCLLVWLLCSF